MKTAVITGACHGIGKSIKEMFLSKNIRVCDIDIIPGGYFVGDVGDKQTLESFAKKVIDDFGSIDFLINNAPPAFIGINECGYEAFVDALNVGVTSAFYLTKLFLPHFNEGASIVNISSSRDSMSMPQSESYSAAKGGIRALTHALAISLSGRVRVNSISPGWIENDGAVYTGADAKQIPVGRVGRPEDIANAVMFLCSDESGFITGENLLIDGGMSRLMIYHGDNNWSLNE
ncbi:MAG: SDR family oxidoreductase [Christensenellaceae bacterium]|nr:SDR family oxidoreductase [Christensenellaceae bacterium]